MQVVRCDIPSTDQIILVIAEEAATAQEIIEHVSEIYGIEPDETHIRITERISNNLMIHRLQLTLWQTFVG